MKLYRRRSLANTTLDDEPNFAGFPEEPENSLMNEESFGGFPLEVCA
jgi:hypothetical protein